MLVSVHLLPVGGHEGGEVPMSHDPDHSTCDEPSKEAATQRTQRISSSVIELRKGVTLTTLRTCSQRLLSTGAFKSLSPVASSDSRIPWNSCLRASSKAWA